MTTQSASAVTVDLDDAENDILTSMSADDRQSRAEYQAGCKALAALLQELRAHRALLLAIHDLASARLNGANKLSPWEYWEHDMREIERLSSET